jgi:spore coat protein CotH
VTRRARLVLCAAVLAVGCVQTAVAFSRSLIPYGIDGTLESTGVVGDSNQEIFTVTIDGEVWVTDDPNVHAIRVGRRVTKEPWSAEVVLDGRKTVRLTVGDEAFRFAALTVLAVGLAWFLTADRPGRWRQ